MQKTKPQKKRYGVIVDYIWVSAARTLPTIKKVAELIKYLRHMNDELNIPHCIKNYGADSYPTENGFVPENVFPGVFPKSQRTPLQTPAQAPTPSAQPGRNGKLLKCCYYDTEVDF